VVEKNWRTPRTTANLFRKERLGGTYSPPFDRNQRHNPDLHAVSFNGYDPNFLTGESQEVLLGIFQGPVKVLETCAVTAFGFFKLRGGR